MKGNEIESPQRTSSRTQSASSSRFKLSTLGKGRRKNVTSGLLQQRLAIRVIEDNVNVTPKLLTHSQYSSIEDRQLTAFETIGLIQPSSSAQLTTSPSGLSALRSSSSMVVRSSSLPVGAFSSDEIQVESLLSTQIFEQMVLDDQEDRAPSQFYLPCIDPNVLYTRPETVKITLKETETFFIFEMIQLTGDLRTPEGIAIQQENQNYEYTTIGPSSNRKLVNAETQTIKILTKSRGTYLGRKTRKNQGMFVNNWVMHDTYATPELMMEANSRIVLRTHQSLQQAAELQRLQHKLPEDKLDGTEAGRFEDRVTHLFQRKAFQDAVQVMERIIANNVFIEAQKRFTGLIKQDPCSLDLEFTYSLDLLWSHACTMTRGRAVSRFRWNYTNKTILAVAYGTQVNAETKDGLLLIWCAKNPGHPGRSYLFDSPISDIDWSRDRPNLLAVGFYNGVVNVIDISSRDLNVIRKSERASSSSSSPHWQVQWWSGDEQFDYQEQIYTCNQEGCVFRYRCTEDFTSTSIMRIFKLEGKVPGVARISHCNLYDIPIKRSPGALTLCQHPTSSNIYFVGSDEGCVYKCSTNYLFQHIEHFLAHDGPIYAMAFSPFCSKIFLTCGADWCTRVWAEGITEPLITLSTKMACVRYAAWCPTYSTIIASIVSNEICIWDIKRKVYAPTSVTISPNASRFVMIDFAANGNQLVVADVDGVTYIYNLEGMPFPPYNQQLVLIESIKKTLVTKPSLLKKLTKLGPPF